MGLGFFRLSILFLSFLPLVSLSGCFTVPLHPEYSGPDPRPVELEQYYDVANSYTDYLDEIILEEDDFTVRRIYLDTDFGEVTVDYFQGLDSNPNLIFVFPVKGGRNSFSNYFARYFVRHGFDAAVVHRDGAFKDSKNFEQLEDIFHKHLIRDRIVIDFFEDIFGKSEFGSFGISRGAVNAAAVAGVDSRLKYNVLALAAADLVGLFVHSTDRGMVKYRKRVMDERNIDVSEYEAFIQKILITNPSRFASHIDARNTLMFIALFDDVVPVSYGLELRRTIGYPHTEFIVSGHYSALAYTCFVQLLVPYQGPCFFPFDYVEDESLAFFHSRFGKPRESMRKVLFSIIKAPMTLLAELITRFF